MKRQVESAKYQPVTIDGKNGTCTPTPSKIKLNALEDVRREMASVYREARAGIIDTSEAHYRRRIACQRAILSNVIGYESNNLGRQFYNYHRPHGGRGGNTPYERLVEKIR